MTAASSPADCPVFPQVLFDPNSPRGNWTPTNPSHHRFIGGGLLVRYSPSSL